MIFLHNYEIAKLKILKLKFQKVVNDGRKKKIGRNSHAEIIDNP